MNKAQLLRKRFEEDLADLQTWCEHVESEAMPHMWAPGHISGSVLVCKECDKVLKRLDDEIKITISTT